MLQRIIDGLNQRGNDVIRLQRELTALPALGPENDGIGEEHKARFILDELQKIGVDNVTTYHAPDERVPCQYRPNIVAHIPGKQKRTLWILAHMDVVPVGDLSLWKADPFILRVEGDVLIGRGVEDNQQAIVSALLLLDEVKKSGAVPEFSLGCIFVSDEETGNALGIEWLMRTHGHIFSKEDVFVAPDFGAPDGSMLLIAEKHVLWLSFCIEGKQCHGSMPHKGKNAMLAGCDLVLALQELHALFPEEDALFDPPMSTFTPTKRELNVQNVNTVPGKDIFYVDCRVLPCYSLDEVKAAAEKICQDIAQKHGVNIQMNVFSEQLTSPATPKDCELVQMLAKAVENLSGVQVRLMGVGGGTVAKEIRKEGMDAVVWSRLLANCHEPEEKSLISNAIFDAQVFAHIIFQGKDTAF